MLSFLPNSLELRNIDGVMCSFQLGLAFVEVYLDSLKLLSQLLGSLSYLIFSHM